MIYSDAARRCSDVINGAVHVGGVGLWVAVRLSDGGSDGVRYASRGEAIRFQLHETLCAYVKVPPDGMQPREAERFLEVNRLLYDAGLRLTDPDVDREFITPYTNEDMDYLRKALK